MPREKFFINSPQTAVDYSIEGFVRIHPNVQLIKGSRIVIRKDLGDVHKKGQVTLLCGGGSGHEPCQAGFVGRGMLTAAVSGDIFASPPVHHIYAALCQIYSSSGTVVVVTNYTGDRLNFGMAIEEFRARHKNSKVEMILVEDDLATQDNCSGARGVFGTVMVSKILGAMAEMGRTFEEVLDCATLLKTNILTLAASLGHCCIPGSKKEGSDCQERGGASFYEIGLGIHNEPGAEMRSLEPAAAVVNCLMERLLQTNIRTGSRLAIGLNNLGGLSVLEMNILAGEVSLWCMNHHIAVDHFLGGTIMTSIDMPGFSVTVMTINEDISQYFTAATECVAWPQVFTPNTDPFLPNLDAGEALLDDSLLEVPEEQRLPALNSDIFRNALLEACKVVSAAEEELNRLDAVSGDGDCGSTMKRLTEAIIEDECHYDYRNPKKTFSQLSRTSRNICGSSGALYGILFGAFSDGLAGFLNCTAWSVALESALQRFMVYSRARPGQKSMLDPLIAFNERLQDFRQVSSEESFLQVLRESALAAVQSAENTKDMESVIGRGSYSNHRKDVQRVADPGAVAVGLWVQAICRSVSSVDKVAVRDD